jgi:hypothetical protein
MKDTMIKIERFVARRTHQAETIVIFIVASEIISLFFFLLLQSRWLGLEVNVVWNENARAYVSNELVQFCDKSLYAIIDGLSYARAYVTAMLAWLF